MPEEIIDYKDFAEDLAEYIKDEDVEKWESLTEKYPFQAEGEDRYIFLPEDHIRVNESQPSNFLVSGPVEDDLNGDKPHEDDLYSDVAEYLSIEGAVEKLVKLAEMQDRYESTSVNEGKVRFGSVEETGLEVSLPTLEEVAESYNESEGTPFQEFDKDMLGDVASRTSVTIGSFEKTVYVQGPNIYVEEDTDEGTKFYKVDNVGDAISLDEVIEVYEMVRDGLSPDSGKEMFENITKLFEVSQDGEKRIMMDLVNEEVVIQDMATVDLTRLNFEETDEELKRYDREEVTEMIADFYSRIKQ